MTPLTVDAGVKLLVTGRALVARAAVAHAAASLRACRVRIVAAHARTNLALFRVVGVLVGVTARARLIGTAPHVVLVVAVRALSMARRVPRREHGNVVVAGPALDCVILAETVRLMTAYAGDVTAVEQGSSGNYRSIFLVTRHASAERIRCGGVLLLMTRGADLIG